MIFKLNCCYLLIIIITIIICIQGIYNYTPETNHVYRVYFAAILWLQYMVHVAV